jgi:hypothetical protein
MAQEVVDDEVVEVVQVQEDNALGMTSALVFLTFVILLVAFIMVEIGLKKWFGSGFFGG